MARNKEQGHSETQGGQGHLPRGVPSARRSIRRPPRRPAPIALAGLMLATFLFAGLAFMLFGSVVPQFGTAESSATGANASATPTAASAYTPTAGASMPIATETPTVEPTATPAVYMTVAATDGRGVNLRSQPGTGAEIIGALQGGTKVKLLGQGASADGYNWKNVETPDGKKGWVVADFLSGSQ
jgi:Bacterial SH3 domain